MNPFITEGKTVLKLTPSKDIIGQYILKNGRKIVAKVSDQRILAENYDWAKSRSVYDSYTGRNFYIQISYPFGIATTTENWETFVPCISKFLQTQFADFEIQLCEVPNK